MTVAVGTSSPGWTPQQWADWCGEVRRLAEDRDAVVLAHNYQPAPIQDVAHFLDATGLGADHLERRFPSILRACRDAGLDPATQPLPVALRVLTRTVPVRTGALRRGVA